MTDIDPAIGLGYLTPIESGRGEGCVLGSPFNVESAQLYRAADRGTS